MKLLPFMVFKIIAFVISTAEDHRTPQNDASKSGCVQRSGVSGGLGKRLTNAILQKQGTSYFKESRNF